MLAQKNQTDHLDNQFGIVESDFERMATILEHAKEMFLDGLSASGTMGDNVEINSEKYKGSMAALETLVEEQIKISRAASDLWDEMNDLLRETWGV